MLTLISTFFRYKFRHFPDRAYFERWQNEQVERFLHKTVPLSPFYRDAFDGFDLSDWRRLPMIDKERMMANFSRLNTAGLSREVAMTTALRAEKTRDFKPQVDNFTVGLSSGTSGHRGLFLVSAEERQRWAGVALAKLLDQSLLSKQRIAFFLRANSNLYETVNSRRINFRFFDLLARPESYVDQLNQYRPTYLIGPPSLLRYLAQFLRAGQLKIMPKKIVSVAEMLDPIDKREIESAFDQILHQVYQCTEGFLASTCRYGTLHLHEDIVAFQLEPLADDLSSGARSRRFMPIITDFQRTTQPIIRYRLDDILIKAEEPCRCGSIMTTIEGIEGRYDDLFFLQENGNRRLIPLYPDYIRRAILRSSGLINAYQARQTGLFDWEIDLLLPDEQYRQPIERQISDHIQRLAQQLGAHAPEIKYGKIEVERPSGVKRRRVIQQWNRK